jgi:hypothetical protein
MEKYLQKEETLIKQTNFFFENSKKVITHWYSVLNGKIYPHPRLINAVMHKPDYLIFERYDDSHNPILVTIYYDMDLNPIPYLPFEKWKLYENRSAFGRRKYFLLEDPVGIKNEVKLSDYFPSVPGALEPYIKFNSFEEFSTLQQNPNT